MDASVLTFRVRGQTIYRVAVRVETHPLKNSVKGVITCFDLRVGGGDRRGYILWREVELRRQGAYAGETDEL